MNFKLKSFLMLFSFILFTNNIVIAMEGSDSDSEEYVIPGKHEDYDYSSEDEDNYSGPNLFPGYDKFQENKKKADEDWNNFINFTKAAPKSIFSAVKNGFKSFFNTAVKYEATKSKVDDESLKEGLNFTKKVVFDKPKEIVENKADEIYKKVENKAIEKGNAITKNILDKVEVTTKKTVEDLTKKSLVKFDDFSTKLLIKTSAVTLGVVASIYLMHLGYKKLDKYLAQPRLFNETSQKGITDELMDFFFSKEASILPSMFFSKELDKRLKDIIAETQVLKGQVEKGFECHYQNLMLYGPSGTGKTMFAKQLAKQSGMEYRSMSGASFSKFTKVSDGIEAIDELFNYAEKSKKKLLIFIDEAESFLAARNPGELADESNKLLTCFIGHISKPSKNFMFVFATNHPHSLDAAVLDRISEKVEVGLPEFNERKKIISYFRDTLLCDSKSSVDFIDAARTIFNDEFVSDLAVKFKGFSARELLQFINKVKVKTFITQSGLVTEYLVETIAENFLNEHKLFHSENDNKVAN